MKTLITGHEGFIGSHFLKNFYEEFPESEVVVADLKDGKDFADIKGQHFDVVVHFAANVSVIDSLSNPVDVMKNNAFKIADLINNNTIERFALISTVGVYPESENVTEDMSDWRNCKSTYSLSKYLAEFALAQALDDDHIKDFSIFRLSNVIGEGVRDNWSVIEHFENDNPIVLYGGTQYRDFINVDVVVEAIIYAIKNYIWDIFTLASGTQESIFELAQRYALKRGVPLTTAPARGDEIIKQSFDISKAKKMGLIK